ncbi:MAG: site-2 protease family protein [Planctomycetes bacterium]|nr:site-2 protease family protein [Planctomycetota bacterium]
MFGKKFRLFDMFGFSVRADVSWLFIVLLVTWTLAVGYFPAHYAGYSTATYWAMGLACALGLFLSIVIHELSHSIVATRFGLPMKGITLFIFGGVAEMSDEPPSPKAEFVMAAAGPIASLILAVSLFGLHRIITLAGGPELLAGSVWYLGFINALLAAFNLLPGFPLDGGRILRSALWHWKGDLKWATRLAAQIGSGFGAVLMILGVLNFIWMDFVGGMWWFLIGMFLRGAASQSYRDVVVRQALAGETLEHIMNRTPVTVAPDTSLEQLVDDFVYKYHHKMFPVTTNGTLLGCVTLQQIREVPREARGGRTVGDIVERCGPDNSIAPGVDAMEALSQMTRTGRSRLLVVDGTKLVGLVTLKDMLQFLSVKTELESED